MTSSRNAKVKETIYDLLVRDRVARTDDVYLYKKVIAKLSPNLLTQPFGDVLLELYNTNNFDNGFINFETVRRARADIQSKHSELVDDNTYKKRKKSQEFYIKKLLMV